MSGTNGSAGESAPSIFHHVPGQPAQCLCLALTVEKELLGIDESRQPSYGIGLKIGGGIDQDPKKSPYSDKGVYVTHVDQNSPAERSGIRVGDKILEVNGRDFTMLTHEKAVKYMRQDAVLNVLVTRAELL